MITSVEDYLAWLGGGTTSDKIQSMNPAEDYRSPGGSEPYFDVNLNNRMISVPATFSYAGVAGDVNAEKIYFRTDRYFDNMDLSTVGISIRYIAGQFGNNRPDIINGEDLIITSDLILAGENEDILIIPWSIPAQAAVYAGIISISLKFYIIEQDKYIFKIKTRPSSISFYEGLPELDLSQTEYEALASNIDLIIEKLNRVLDGETLPEDIKFNYATQIHNYPRINGVEIHGGDNELPLLESDEEIRELLNQFNDLPNIIQSIIDNNEDMKDFKEFKSFIGITPENKELLETAGGEEYSLVDYIGRLEDKLIGLSITTPDVYTYQPEEYDFFMDTNSFLLALSERNIEYWHMDNSVTIDNALLTDMVAEAKVAYEKGNLDKYLATAKEQIRLENERRAEIFLGVNKLTDLSNPDIFMGEKNVREKLIGAYVYTDSEEIYKLAGGNTRVFRILYVSPVVPREGDTNDKIYFSEVKFKPVFQTKSNSVVDYVSSVENKFGPMETDNVLIYVDEKTTDVKRDIVKTVDGAIGVIPNGQTVYSYIQSESSVLREYVDEGLANVEIDVDNSLNEESENPVQNKVIYDELFGEDGLENRISKLETGQIIEEDVVQYGTSLDSLNEINVANGTYIITVNAAASQYIYIKTPSKYKTIIKVNGLSGGFILNKVEEDFTTYKSLYSNLGNIDIEIILKEA